MPLVMLTLVLLLTACAPTIPPQLPTEAALPTIVPTLNIVAFADVQFDETTTPLPTATAHPTQQSSKTPTPLPATWTPLPPTATLELLESSRGGGAGGAAGNVALPVPSPTVFRLSFESVITGVGPRAQAIYERGQTRGQRAGVFSKVGDSITVATYFLYPMGWATPEFGQYERLRPIHLQWAANTARDGNSFSNTSLTADNGWTSGHVLDPTYANLELCLPGESPLLCEYRHVRPSVALVMLGSNDVALLSPEDFSSNLQEIVRISVAEGVVPVVSTIPNRGGYEAQVVQFNNAIRVVAANFEVPLWDYHFLMEQLPNGGLSGDALHPSWPPGSGPTDFAAAARFTSNNLRYGYTVRNLSALIVLDALSQLGIGS